MVHHVPRIHEYAVSRYSPAALDAVERQASAKLLRLAAEFDAFAPDCAGRTVVLCDDGLATGATMTAALRVVSLLGPASLVVAVPVSPAKVLRELSAYADAVVCFRSPPDFSSVGTYYEDFSQVSEPEILRLFTIRHRAVPASRQPATPVAASDLGGFLRSRLHASRVARADRPIVSGRERA